MHEEEKEENVIILDDMPSMWDLVALLSKISIPVVIAGIFFLYLLR